MVMKIETGMRMQQIMCVDIGITDKLQMQMMMMMKICYDF